MSCSAKIVIGLRADTTNDLRNAIGVIDNAVDDIDPGVEIIAVDDIDSEVEVEESNVEENGATWTDASGATKKVSEISTRNLRGILKRLAPVQYDVGGIVEAICYVLDVRGAEYDDVLEVDDE